MLRIGHISYANCTPLFYALTHYHDCSNYVFVKGVPSELNRLLLNGDIDVSPSSSIELARHPDLYCLLPDLSISSFGKVGSIILFSKIPLEELNREKIALTQASTTSSFLLRIIMGEFLKMENTFHEEGGPLEEVLKRYKAFLLIGDDALKAVISNEFRVTSKTLNSNPPFTPLLKGGEEGLFAKGEHGGISPSSLYTYDLGELWYRFTHLPFVFALWLVRKDSLKSKEKEIVRLGRDLLLARDMAFRNLENISDDVEETNWMPKRMLTDYWENISYALNDIHLEGLREFYRYAEKLSVIEKLPILEECILSTIDIERRKQ
ncbi:MAG: menaquinone biosynthesis protein [Nitrospirota bacterium]